MGDNGDGSADGSKDILCVRCRIGLAAYILPCRGMGRPICSDSPQQGLRWFRGSYPEPQTDR